MNPTLLALSAEVIVIDAHTAAGQGAVQLSLDGEQAEAAAFSLSLDDNRLTLIDGTWLRADGDRLSFARADLALGEDLSGVLLEARYSGERMVASGSTLRILDADTLQGEDLTVTVCGCEVPTWDVTARAVTVELDEVARFTGGWIRVCERRVLPIPAGIIPLAERRSGLLPPQVGFSQDGLILAQPAYLTLGTAADLTLAPEWRTDRGLRGQAGLRYALAPGGLGGQLDGALGYDTSLEQWRGAASLRHASRRGALRTAVDSRYQSDTAYLSDYGGDFLSRATPWMESRALLAAGPLRLETDTFQIATPAQQRPLGMVLSGVATPGPVSTFGYARLDLLSTGDDPLRLEDTQPRLRTGLRADYGRQISAIRAELRAMGEGISWGDSEGAATPWGWAGAEAEVSGLLWGDVGAWRHLADVGVVALSGVATDAAVVRAPDEALPAAWGVGPTLTSRWLSRGGVPLSVSARAPWSGPEAGWQWLATARWSAGAWSGRLQAEPSVAYGEAGWSQERRSVRLTGAWVEGVVQAGGQARWTLPGALRPVSVGWGHLYDVLGQRTLSAGPSLGYHSPCDCLDVQAGVVWSQDRAAPDARLSVQIR